MSEETPEEEGETRGHTFVEYVEYGNGCADWLGQLILALVLVACGIGLLALAVPLHYPR